MVQMEHAEQRGDRHSARALARAIVASGERPLGATAAEEAGEQLESEQALHSARDLLARTEPDPFLFAVGIAGLGLLVWLVYSYVL
jgi:hypothetical protein